MIYILAEMTTYGDFFCNIVERTAELLPPSPFTFSSLVGSYDPDTTFVSRLILYEMLNFLWQLGGAVATYKVFKILPAMF